MNSALGFTLIWRGSETQVGEAYSASNKLLAYFPDLSTRSVQVGETRLLVWGRGALETCIHKLPDGAILALIGSPVGAPSWDEVQQGLLRLPTLREYRLPWEGRAILLYISPEGNRWLLWNDWLGSIPVYRSETSKCRIASTLEPAVVAFNNFSSKDLFMPGLLTLLILGNLLKDWTIFKGMHTVAPDSVTVWEDDRHTSFPCETIQATDGRWETGWDDLMEEMHSLLEKTILTVFKTNPDWIIPLSSGLDSRLLATIGVQANVNVRTYTWGLATTQDVIYSRKISRVLGVPWQHIDLGSSYLSEHIRKWAAMFGSSMHFHGMYQFPFLDRLRSEPTGKIISGFMGDTLGGYEIQFQTEYHTPNLRTPYAHPPGWCFWLVEELKDLFPANVDDAVEQITELVTDLKTAKDGPWFQKIRFLTLWGRQNHFTYFQSMLSDYWLGVGTPYINREYAQFAMSLPRAALENRRLQIAMMARYYPKVMSVPGSYALEPAIMSGSYILKRRLARSLPKSILKRVLPEFARIRNYQTDVNAIQASKEKALWPIPETEAELSSILNFSEIKSVYQKALSGDYRSLRKLQSIQALAYPLLRTHP